MRKFLKVGALLLGVVVLLLLALLALGWWYSPGETPPITDAKGEPLPNSIALSERVVLGGVEQWILIRGKDQSKPVLLFLHGGPGSPEALMFRKFNEALEAHFVVVHWDQRGSGKSYSENIPAESFSIQQFVQDAHELSNLLRQRFGQDKIWLMGHSWGSVLGVLTVKENPEPFKAYIGIGQVAHMQEGERLSYEYVLNTARDKGNEDALEELEAIGPPPYTTPDWMERILKERNWVAKFDGAWYGKDNMLDIIMPILSGSEYSLSDKVNYMRGALRTLELMWPELMSVNLFEQAPELGVPVYIFQGKNDYQTPYVLAHDYFQQLKAPRKKFYAFSNTAHSPLYEHPEIFHEVLLNKVVPDVERLQDQGN